MEKPPIPVRIEGGECVDAVGWVLETSRTKCGPHDLEEPPGLKPRLSQIRPRDRRVGFLYGKVLSGGALGIGRPAVTSQGAASLPIGRPSA